MSQGTKLITNFMLKIVLEVSIIESSFETTWIYKSTRATHYK